MNYIVENADKVLSFLNIEEISNHRFLSSFRNAETMNPYFSCEVVFCIRRGSYGLV